MIINDMDEQTHTNNWAKCNKNLLDNTSFSEVWNSQGIGNIQLFLSSFKQRIRDIFVENWDSQISNSARASTYSLFSQFDFKLYLDKINFELINIDVLSLD